MNLYAGEPNEALSLFEISQVLVSGFLNFQFQDFSILLCMQLQKKARGRKRGELNDPDLESICRDANCHGTVFEPLRNDGDRVG